MVDIAEPNLNRLEASLNPGIVSILYSQTLINNLKGDDYVSIAIWSILNTTYR